MVSTAAQRSGLRGVSELRRALKGLPISMRKEIGMAIAESAVLIHDDMYQFAPKQSGQTANQIESEISSDKLEARIGFVSPESRRMGFVARFLEKGTKGAPERNIPAMPAQPFIAPALDVNETQIRGRINDAIRKAIGGSRIGRVFGYG
ncbi:MAG: hypothetical protein KG075_17590 [Alphaproteobacteria bacterium]|nr:hypothetical protein [Alphaproteobacteria bacterium]